MKAKTPFVFSTSSQLVQITGKKASDLKQLAEILKTIDESAIFYHVHHAFREHNFAPGYYSNDFARWVNEELGEAALAERLANINIKDFTELKALRARIVEIIEDWLQRSDGNRLALPGHEFYFCKNIGVIQKTRYTASDLDEFCAGLKQVGLRSLFFHFFESRLRLNRQTNDFSNWIKSNFAAEATARSIESLDPYLYTMDELRDKIISIVASGGEPTFWDKVKKWLGFR